MPWLPRAAHGFKIALLLLLPVSLWARSASTTSFVNAGGTPVSNYILSTDKVYVQVQDADWATSTITLSLVQVNRTGADKENNLILTQVAAGLYRGPASGLSTAFRDPPTPYNGTLEANNFDTITAVYIDPGDATDVSIATAGLRKASTAATVQLSNSTYTAAKRVYLLGRDSLYFKVADSDANNDQAVVDQISVTVSDSGGDTENVSLTETGADTGNFTGSLTLVSGSAVSGNGRIESASGHTVTLRYVDNRYSPGETVTDQSLVQALTASTTQFTNSGGTVQASYVIVTDLIYVRVNDKNADTDPATQQTVQVTLTDATTADSEILILQETTASSGVFQNIVGFPSARGSAIVGNGTLEVHSGDTITASYVDPLDGSDRTSSTATMRVAPTQAALSFSDAAGNAQYNYTIGSDRVYVTVNDPDRNQNETAVDSVNVVIRDSQTNDQETLALVETGVNTGLFRGPSGGLASARVFTAVTGNNFLETLDGSIVTATYTDPVNSDTASGTARMNYFTPSTTKFTDAYGNPKTNFSIGTDLVYVTVTDADRNSNSSLAETIVATVNVSSTGDSEAINLTETGVSTGVFRNQTGVSIQVAPASSNGIIDVVAGSQARAVYADSHEPADTTQDIATVSRPPVNGTIKFSDSLQNPKTQFVIGTENIYVKVTDANQNKSASIAETVNVTVSSSRTGDKEGLTLTETGLNTGVFFGGGIGSATGTAVIGDRILQTSNQDPITVTYTDPDTPTDTVSDFATMRTPPTPSSIAFTDASGNPKSQFRIGDGDIYLTLTDLDQNTDPSTAQTVIVTAKNLAITDQEFITLTETGPNTGVFRNASGIGSSLRNTSIPGNGVIEARDNDSVTVTYTDPSDPTDVSTTGAILRYQTTATIHFTDAAGTVKSQYVIGQEPIFLTLTDQDRGSASSPPPTTLTLFASVYDPLTGDVKLVTLTELPAQIGTFRNLTGLVSVVGAANSGDPRLMTSGNTVVRANYTDPQDSSDTASTTATMKTSPTQGFLDFADSTWITTGTIFIGEGFNVRLVDQGLNANPVALDQAYVTLVDGATGDIEYILLRETAANSGEFRNLSPIPAASAASIMNNGTLETADGALVTVNFTDQDHPGFFATASARARIKPNPGNPRTATFTNSLGTPVTTYGIGQDLIYVTVHETDANANAQVVDTVYVTVRNFSQTTPPGDTVVLRLDEINPANGQVSPNSGWFRNQTGLSSVLAAFPNSSDTILQTRANDYVTIDYVSRGGWPASPLPNPAQMLVGPSGSRTYFTDLAGNVKTQFTISSDGVYVTVEDTAQNKDPGTADIVFVQLSSTVTGATQSVSLTETGLNTGVFRNISPVQTSLDSIPGSPDGRFHTADGAVITARFQDPDYPSVVSSGQARMQVLEVPASSITLQNTSGGAAASQFQIFTTGLDTAFVRVQDSDKNTDPTTAQSIRVTLIGSNSPVNDTETIVLPETGLNTGIFQSTVGMTLTLGGPSSGNGSLETVNGGTVTARYVDPLNPADQIQTSVPVTMGKTPMTALYFSDSTGTRKDTFIVSTEPLYVTLTDRDRSTTPGVNATVQVTLSCAGTGDQYLATLLETSPGSGTFRNTSGIVTEVAPPSTVDSRLQVTVNTSVTVDYVDPSETTDRGTANALMKPKLTPSSISFTDAAGNTKTSFTILSDLIYVTVTDANQNKNPLVAETIQVNLTSSITNDTLTIVLTETAPNTGVFRNLVGGASVVGIANTSDTIIQTAIGANLTANYIDPDDPTDTREAVVQMKGPRTAAQAYFIKSLGATQTTSVFTITSDLIYARIIDADRNANPTQVESFQAFLNRIRRPPEMTSPPALPSPETQDDQEIVTFVEVSSTGAQSTNSAIFETVVPMSSQIARIVPGNGIIDAAGGSVLNLRYVDSTDPTDIATRNATLVLPTTIPTIRFTDVGMTTVTTYGIGSANKIFLTVTDAQANNYASVPDSVVVSIYDTVTGDIVGVSLAEVLDSSGFPSTGIFKNTDGVASTVGLPPQPVTTSLYTAQEAVIIGSYLKTGTGGPSVQNPPYDPTVQKILTKIGPNGKSCYSCHSDVLDPNPLGGFNISGYRDFIKGGTQSPITSGNAQMSLLVRKLETPVTSPYALSHGLPPGVGDPTLKVDQVISRPDLETLKAWINHGAVAPTLPTSISYNQIQTLVFTPSCAVATCHDFASQAGGIRLNDYSGFWSAATGPKKAVLFGDGPGSTLVRVVVDSAFAHTGGWIGSPRIPLISVQWLSMYISQQYAARNTRPLMEYTGDVQPLFDRYCISCHNRSTRNGGLDISSYLGVSGGGNSGAPIANPGDIPKSLILRKVDRSLDTTHSAMVPAGFYNPAGNYNSQPFSILTSWVRQGASPGTEDILPLPPTGAVTTTAVMKGVPSSATIQFTDLVGIPVTFYKIADEGIYVTVIDVDQNKNPTLTQTLTVVLTDTRTGDTETVTLTALNPGSSEFRNKTPILSEVGMKIPGDGKIQTVNNSTLTATYADSPPPAKTATVTMTTTSRSQIQFVDSGGLPRGIFAIGTEPVFIQVTAMDKSGTGALAVQSVSVTVTPSGDKESLSLRMDELPAKLGVFRSQALPTSIGVTVTAENGGLETTHLGLLTAIYTNPTFAQDTCVTTAVTKVPSTTAVVSFTNKYGATQTAFNVGVEDLYVRVVDKDRDTSPTTTQSITLVIRNEAIADVETVTLFEVGKNTGVFQSLSGLPTVLTTGTGIPGNNTLEIRDLNLATFSERVRADYVDTDNPPDNQSAFADVLVCTAGVIQFINVAGAPVTQYTRGQELIFLKVVDPDKNRNKSVKETVVATVYDDISGDSETVTLTETNVSSGVFQSQAGLPSIFAFPLPPKKNNRVFETRVNSFLYPAQTIRARYVDPRHPADVAQTTAKMIPKDPNDSDDDGIPDAWELAHGMNPYDPTDAAMDFDSDGWTNLEEFREGTDPLNPWDHKPVADAGNGFNVDPGYIQLDGSSSHDPRGLALTYTWTQVGVGLPGHGPTVTLSNRKGVNPWFVGFGGRDQNLNDFSWYDFDLVVSNYRVSSNPNRIRVIVNNVPPTVFAGVNQAIELGSTIALNGSGTKDANNEPLKYLWSAPGSVDFQGNTKSTPSPIVTPHAVGANKFTLRADDLALNSATNDSYLVVHSPTNHVPLADAGPRVTGRVNESIAIDGTLSADADAGDSLTYLWSVTKTPPGVTNLAPVPAVSTLGRTNLVAPRTGYYEVTLTVQDSSGNLSVPTTTGVVVNFPGSATQTPVSVPNANAGKDQMVNSLQKVTLDGSASRGTVNTALTFKWLQVGGVYVKMAGADTAYPTLVPIFAGVYKFRLTVFDGTNESAPSDVNVTVHNPVQGVAGPKNYVPIADAGDDQAVQVGTQPVTVVLDGSSSSDQDNDSLVYYWTQVSGPGVPLGNPNTSRPNFKTSKIGRYVFDMVVFDGKCFSLPSRTSVQVTPLGKDAPVANAGSSQTVYLVGGSVTVQLDGRGSYDPQGKGLTYQWSQVQGTPVDLQPSASSPTPYFFASQLGNYRFRLVVRDPYGLTSNPADVLITVVSGENNPPVVKVNGSGGPTASVQAVTGQAVTLDASQSAALAGGSLTYIWKQVSGPVNIVLTNSAQAALTVKLTARGTYTFAVTVIDGHNNRSDGTVTIFVAPSVAGTNGTGLGVDPAPVVSGTGGGGGGGGCHASPGGSSLEPSSLLVFFFWIALLVRRFRPARDRVGSF